MRAFSRAMGRPHTPYPTPVTPRITGAASEPVEVMVTLRSGFSGFGLGMATLRA